MSMNSMYPDGWFALGAAALKVNCVVFIIFVYYLFTFVLLDLQ